jgi:CRP-like cAMP-binding protein
MNEADFDLGDLGEGVRLAHPATGDGKDTPTPAADPPSGPTAQSSIPPEQAIELLSKIGLFSALQPTYLRRIATLGLEEDYAQDAVIFKEGAVGDKVYLIIGGAVRISRTVPGMGEEALAVLRAGTHFGEMALIDDFPRSADARAHEPCRLFVIRKEDLEDLLFVDRDLAYDLLWSFVRTLSGRLRETNDKMTFMAVTSKF